MFRKIFFKLDSKKLLLFLGELGKQALSLGKEFLSIWIWSYAQFSNLRRTSDEYGLMADWGCIVNLGVGGIQNEELNLISKYKNSAL